MRRPDPSLFESERAHLAAIVESSSDAIVSKTLDGIVTSWNPAAERIFGYTSEEAVGRSILILFPPDRVHEEEEILGHIARGELVDHFETVRQRKDGTLIDVSVTVSPIRDGEGRIVGASKIARDITEKKRLEREAKEREAELTRTNLELERLRAEMEQAWKREAYRALHDPLTDLPNRRLFRAHLATVIARADRNRECAGLLFIDLDDFKAVNDELGHQAGDQLLVSVAKRLRHSLRGMDLVARLGGDEFAVAAEEVDAPESLRVLARKVLGAVADPFLLDAGEVRLSASVGISRYPEDGDNPDDLLRRADQAMYRVKKGGKNAFQFYEHRTDS